MNIYIYSHIYMSTNNKPTKKIITKKVGKSATQIVHTKSTTVAVKSHATTTTTTTAPKKPTKKIVKKSIKTDPAVDSLENSELHDLEITLGNITRQYNELKQKYEGLEIRHEQAIHDLNKIRHENEKLRVELNNMRSTHNSPMSSPSGGHTITTNADNSPEIKTIHVEKREAKCKFCKRTIKICNAQPCEKKLYKKLGDIGKPNMQFAIQPVQISPAIMEEAAGHQVKGDVLIFKEVVLKPNITCLATCNKKLVYYDGAAWKVDDTGYVLDEFYQFIAPQYFSYLKYLFQRKVTYSKHGCDLDSALLNETIERVNKHMRLVSLCTKGTIENPQNKGEKITNAMINQSKRYRNRVQNAIIDALLQMQKEKGISVDNTQNISTCKLETTDE